MQDGLQRIVKRPELADLVICTSARELVEKLLIYEYQLRATVRSALKSSWIVSELEELETLYERRIRSKLENA